MPVPSTATTTSVSGAVVDEEWTHGPFDQLRADGVHERGGRLGAVVAREAQHVAFLVRDAEQHTDRVGIHNHIDVLGVDASAFGVVVHVIVHPCEFGVAASNADDAKPRAGVTRERRCDRERVGGEG